MGEDDGRCLGRGVWDGGAHLATLLHNRLVHDPKRPVANDVLVLKDPLQRVLPA